MKKKIGGYTLAATAFVACPCHLPLTLPLLVVLLGGTSWGVFIAQNTALVYGLAGAYFVFGLLAGVWLVGKAKRAKTADCETCQEPSPERIKLG